MDRRTREKYSDGLLGEAAARYGIDRSSVAELGGFENFVFHCRHEGVERILRIAHSLRRSWEQVSAELDWLAYLAAEGLAVSPAVPSLRGSLCEKVGEADDYFTATVFEKAPGKPADDITWGADLFSEMGRLMGRMHALTKGYQPPVKGRRPCWHEESDGFAARYLPAGNEAIVARDCELAERMRALPAGRDAFGLVHLDFHRGNFLVDRGRVRLFDFDDCQYSWFVDDIAVALFYALPHDRHSVQGQEKARAFLRPFLDAYGRENELGEEWLERIPLFLKRREIDLYVVIHRSVDLSDPSEWTATFLDGRAERIEDGVPYADIESIEL